ncbi:MAG: high-affinity zinc transporter membrane component [Methanoregulaceae archaeon PtaB.Bin108]|jgi:zinc transport system permease protein|nr:MAG: high-affinity zinc transporter membrane component [Methanoregulaceae archaeon PtaB.Bin108]OPY44548.1 MAG: high-affinity zinc transporter membrane component [Methanoregulaceae archaeon PtaU1.Bin222]
MMEAGILGYIFFQNALLAAVFASIVCGIIGSYVVVKQMVSISGGISHAAFGGVGLGYLAGINPIAGAFLFTIFVALGIGILKDKTSQNLDTLVGAVWAAGMAIGIISISLVPGYTPDLFGYLFGNILLVPASDLSMMAGLSILIVAVVLMLFTQLQAVTFDEEYARVMNLPVTWLSILLLVLIAVTVVMLIRVVGIILVIALLTLPAATARKFTTKLQSMMVVSVLLGLVFSTGGLFLSYLLDVPSGATIILLATAGFAGSLLVSREFFK